jgi:hypothetical protein
VRRTGSCGIAPLAHGCASTRVTAEQLAHSTISTCGCVREYVEKHNCDASSTTNVPTLELSNQASPSGDGLVRVGLTHSHMVVHPHAIQLKSSPTVLYERAGVRGICRKSVPRRIEHYERAGSRAIQPSEP